jgi:Ca-activated chloride channel family protein
MTAAFGDGDRYDAAMESINEFINYREGDSFGLTIFGSSLLHWIRVTNDPSAFRYATPFLSPRRLPRWFGGGTRIGYALRSCLDLLIEREEGDRMILLVSDGYSSDLSGGQDAEIARELAANDIVVYAVHVAEGAAPAEVATIAHSTGGEVFAAGDPAALQEVFQRIDKMQGARTETVSAEPVDHFRPYVFAGSGCLGLLLVSMLGVRYTPW